MRTLRILTRLNIGGPAINVTLADAGLRARGYETLLVHGRLEAGEASAAPMAERYGIPMLALPTLVRPVSPGHDLAAWRALVRLLDEQRPHVVHTHTSKAGTLGRLAAQWHNRRLPAGQRCRVVHTFDGNVFEGYFGPLASRLIVATERWLARSTDAIVTVAPRQRDDLVKRYRIAPADRVVVVPHGLDLTIFSGIPPFDAGARHALGLPPDAVIAVFAGRLVPIKDVGTLIEALARTRAACPAAHLVVAGDGPLRAELEAHVDRLGLSTAVTWLGWYRDVARLYAAADLVVLSSRNEGTPLALIEGMAAGRPAVATAVGGVADVVSDGVTGLVVPPGDAGALASALSRLMTDRAARLAMGEAARADIARRYSAARLADDLDRLYRSILERHVAE
jgi:glycosyltransferase involved in cell wall biosynthesis